MKICNRPRERERENRKMVKRGRMNPKNSSGRWVLLGHLEWKDRVWIRTVVTAVSLTTTEHIHNTSPRWLELKPDSRAVSGW